MDFLGYTLVQSLGGSPTVLRMARAGLIEYSGGRCGGWSLARELDMGNPELDVREARSGQGSRNV